MVSLPMVLRVHKVPLYPKNSVDLRAVIRHSHGSRIFFGRVEVFHKKAASRVEVKMVTNSKVLTIFTVNPAITV